MNRSIVLSDDARTVRVPLGDATLQISQTRSGAWRLLQVVDGTCDLMGAAQLLAAELDGETREEITSLELSGTTLRGAGPTSLRLGESICLLDAQGRELTRITDITQGGSVTGTLTDDERLYGTGERFNRLNQRGKKVSIWAVDRWNETEGNSYVPIPLMISSGGYGVYLNRFEYSAFDLGHADENQWRISLRDAPLDLYLFAGTPADILDQYTALTGRSPMPADWAFGIHVCRHVRKKEFATSEGIRAMARAMAASDLPWHSAIIEGWDVYDPATYSDLKVISDELHSVGKKVMAYYATGRIWQFLSQHPFDFYFDALKADASYFVADTSGNIAHQETAGDNPMDAPGEHIGSFVDITNPDAWKWWIQTVSDPLHKTIGIDGAKIDFCEQFPEIDDLRFHNRCSPKGMHHQYPVLFNARMYTYYQKVRPEGGLCFSRGGGIGAQRYPMMWTGDQRREWKSLQAILRGMLSAGLSGIPFMAHDLAGYARSEDETRNVEKDVFIRGAQMACFGPCMQTHGMVTHPHDFDPETIAIYRLYSNMHCALMPYLVEQARVATRTGLPLIRHMILAFPDDERGYDLEDQYMLGDSFLVAPVMTPEDARSLYLPEGRWEPLWGGTPIDGPADLKEVPVPRSGMLVYARRADSTAAGTVWAEIKSLCDHFTNPVEG
ncbi:MAG: glycoside hydrolase family 31 protein [Lentisphaeria bacterium]|nr:glycoside hydrolase family 31 protein [Lentisphaeria bacterium]